MYQFPIHRLEKFIQKPIKLLILIEDEKEPRKNPRNKNMEEEKKKLFVSFYIKSYNKFKKWIEFLTLTSLYLLYPICQAASKTSQLAIKPSRENYYTKLVTIRTTACLKEL